MSNVNSVGNCKDSSKFVYERDESNLRVIPKWAPIFMVFVFFAFIASLILGVSFLIGGTVLYVAWAVFAVSLIISVVSECMFAWFHSVRWYMKQGKLYYGYNLVDTGLSRNTDVSIEIKSVKFIKHKGKRLVLKGIFIKKAPMVKPKELSKVTVQIDHFLDSEVEDILKILEERKEK